ncbi:MAG TPA: aldo/keto reductase [Verrucomicrobiae bacterium]|nr:aldo/keto reductase [Verrucomicrobiae bacterium]
MRSRPLGRGGPQVSEVGIGCNNFGARIDADAARAVVDAALDHGVTLFDTADIYGGGESERFLGRALRGRRDRVLIATKFGMAMPGTDPAQARGAPLYIRAAVEASLRRLDVEVIDLYQIHCPDPQTPIAETLATLHELVAAGTVRFIGCSNFFPWQIADAQWIARSAALTGFVAAQDEYSLLRRDAEAERLPALDHFGLGLLPYFPLAHGLLTGKYRRGIPPPAGTRLGRRPGGGGLLTPDAFDRVEGLERFAAARDLSMLQVAIGSLLSRPVVSSVIAGATSPEQVAANADALTWRPTAQDWAELDGITAPPA